MSQQTGTLLPRNRHERRMQPSCTTPACRLATLLAAADSGILRTPHQCVQLPSQHACDAGSRFPARPPSALPQFNPSVAPDAHPPPTGVDTHGASRPGQAAACCNCSSFPLEQRRRQLPTANGRRQPRHRRERALARGSCYDIPPVTTSTRPQRPEMATTVTVPRRYGRAPIT